MYSEGSGHISTCANLNFVRNALSSEAWLSLPVRQHCPCGRIRRCFTSNTGSPLLPQLYLQLVPVPDSIPWSVLVLSALDGLQVPQPNLGLQSPPSFEMLVQNLFSDDSWSFIPTSCHSIIGFCWDPLSSPSVRRCKA